MKKAVFPKFKQFVTQYIFVITLLLVTTATIGYLTYDHITKKSFDTTVFQKNDYQKFEKYALQNGPEKAYAQLKNFYKNNDPEAHDFAHVVGIVAFEKNGNQGLSVCDTSYNYGCHHGFIEGFIAQKSVSAVGEIEATCIALGQLHAPSCLHGIGHALLINSAYLLQPALDDCNRLAQSSQIYCFDGVFMERIIGSMQTADKKITLTPQTVNEPCQSLDEIYKSQCWRNQVTLWFEYFKSPSDSLKQCTMVEKQYQQICFESVGIANVARNAQNIDALIRDCKIMDSLAIDSCVIGEIRELMFEGRDPQISQALCSATSSQNQNSCYFLLENLKQESNARFQTN